MDQVSTVIGTPRANSPALDELIKGYGCGPSQYTDARLDNWDVVRLAACSLDSIATMELTAMSNSLRNQYGMFKKNIQEAWQHEPPRNRLRRPAPWEVCRQNEPLEVQRNCSI